MLAITVPAASFDLTTLDAVRAELGITDRAEDENLARWIRQASGVVERVAPVFDRGACIRIELTVLG